MNLISNLKHSVLPTVGAVLASTFLYAQNPKAPIMGWSRWNHFRTFYQNAI
jgi:hypothetical protein